MRELLRRLLLQRLLLAAILLLLAVPVKSAWWSRDSKEKQPDQVQKDALLQVGVPFELEMAETPGSERGSKLLEDLKKKLRTSCWHNAYSSLFVSCREVLKDDDKKLRLAYKFADCFLRNSGKDPLKPCSDTAPVKECTKSLSDHRHHLLLQFFIDIASMCHHLQSEQFKLETEEVIVNLKSSAHWVENKLTTMHLQAKRLQEEHLAMEEGLREMHEDLNRGVSHLKEYADETNKHLHSLSSFQKDIADQQEKMAYQQQVLAVNLQGEVSSLKDKADVINTNLVKSLSGQEELLSGQDAAMSTLMDLKKIQGDVLEGGKLLFELHQRLARESEAILKAQEMFTSNQAHIFSSLERLLTLLNVILAESRTLKAFFFYAPVAALIYLLTGTKQTNSGRACLYFGLCIAFGAEFWSLRFFRFSPFYQDEIARNAMWIRGTYSAAALSYILYCICTFKDYAGLSYIILLDIQKKLDENTCLLGSRSSAFEMEFSSPQRNVSSSRGCQDEDEDDDDPDYVPGDDSDEDAIVSHYNLRSNVRRSDRPLAQSAAILEWETEEMFMSLFRPVTPR